MRPLASLRFGWISQLRFSPAGDTLAVAGGGGVALYRGGFGGKPDHSLKAHAAPVKDIAFSPDGAWLASASADTSVKLWRIGASSVCEIASYSGHTDSVDALAFSPARGLLASGGADGRIVLWGADSREILRSLHGHEGGVTALAFDNRGERLFSGGRDGRILRWHPGADAMPSPVGQHGDRVRDMVWLPALATLASASRDGTIGFWREDGEATLVPAHTGGVDALAGSHDGKRFASGGRDKTIRLWRSGDMRQVCEAKAHDKPVLALDLHPRRPLLVSGGGDNLVQLWALA